MQASDAAKQGVQSQSVEELVLQHAVTSTDQQLVCTMAMVCKDWRAAAREAAVGRLHITLDTKGDREWVGKDGPPPGMQKLASFAQWLPKHARMVSRLNIRGRCCGVDSAWLQTHAAPVLGQALRSAAEAVAAASAATAALQLQPLGLQNYSSNIFHDGTVLQALPAASLTELEIISGDKAALAAALPQLSNLQRLVFTASSSCRDSDNSRCIAVVGQSKSLTSLSLTWGGYTDIKLLPVQLKRLDFQSLNVRDSDTSSGDFSHLTRLTSLRIQPRFGPSIGEGLSLPPQLLDLRIDYMFAPDGASVVALMKNGSLSCLEQLTAKCSMESAEDLLQLGALPRLQQLSLSYNNTRWAVAASPAWPRLRQLQAILLPRESYCECSVSSCKALFHSIGSVTHLTRLDIGHLSIKAHEEASIAIYHEIAKLRMLQELGLVIYGTRQKLSWAQADLIHLGTLTQLTKLKLMLNDFRYDVITDATLTGLLPRLQQLRELNVPVQGVAVLSVIADLSSLQQLVVSGLPASEQQSGLHMLRGLTKLTQLGGFEECGKDALKNIWVAVRA